MNKIKKSFIFCLILTLLLSNSVFAATENKNGFIVENGKTYYYQNGIKVTNK